MEPLRFVLHGQIDFANADGLATTLRSAAGQQTGELLVDCADLVFIDAAGLRALIQVHAELAQHDRDLRLIHPSPLLERMLETLDLTYLLGPVLACR